MEYRNVGDIQIVAGEEWYHEQGFWLERRVVGLEGLRSALIIYFIDLFWVYPSSQFTETHLNSILAKISTSDQIRDFFLRLVEWVSTMHKQNNLSLIQDYLNSSESQSNFSSYLNSFIQKDLATDLDLFNFISSSLNINIFIYHSPLSKQLYFKTANAVLSLFIHVSSPNTYSVLYPPNFDSFQSLIKKFDSALDGNTLIKPPTVKLLNRTCQLCKNSYKSYIFPCSCIICHVCIEDNFFIKSYYNCPKCKYKQSVQERTETLHYLKSLQRTLKIYKPE